MKFTNLSGILLCVVLSGCARDLTITRGADSESHWRRRIETAVPIGTMMDEARVIMERNGFGCAPSPAGPEALVCEKLSAVRLGLVSRRWQAWFTVADNRVTAVRSSTGLIGR